MRTHELEIGRVEDAGDLMDFFEDNRIEKGDTLKLLTESEAKGTLVLIIVLVVMVLIRYENKRQKQEDGERLLDDLFKGKSVEEIEKQVEEEYGIKIEVEIKKPDKEREDWNTLAMQSLEKMYEDNEPDYNNIQVQESNPDYKP